jgi:hypothetical protein
MYQGSTMHVDVEQTPGAGDGTARSASALTPRIDPSHRTVQALEDTLRSETRILRDLLHVLHRQRTAVAATDVDAINDNIFAMHRVLLTLAEARRCRQQLVEWFGASPGLARRSHEERSLEFGPWATPPIQDLRDELRLLAATVAREVETNRQILRGIIAAGEELIRVLAGAGVGLPDTSTAPGAPNGSEGALINRTI